VSIDVSVNGNPWKVAIDAGSRTGRYAVTVKGAPREMDIAWIDADTISLIDIRTGVAHEIRLTARMGSVDVLVRDRTFVAFVERKRGQKSDAFASRDGRVVAPMPGRVVRVLVAVGDQVAARQAVVVVEAMKMENELRAPKDGVVVQVSAQEGTAIETGAVLVVVE
jgi:biotin carboxyl carrier protein